MIITSARVIPRPPAEVFRFVATDHFSNHPRWDSDVLEMRPMTAGAMHVGTAARVLRRQGKRTVQGTVTVSTYQPDSVAAFDVRFGVFVLRQRVECMPEQDGHATRLRLTIDTRARGLTRLLVPVMRGRFRRSMELSLAAIAASLGEDNGSTDPPGSRTR